MVESHRGNMLLLLCSGDLLWLSGATGHLDALYICCDTFKKNIWFISTSVCFPAKAHRGEDNACRAFICMKYTYNNTLCYYCLFSFCSCSFCAHSFTASTLNRISALYWVFFFFSYYSSFHPPQKVNLFLDIHFKKSKHYHMNSLHIVLNFQFC